MLERLDNRQWRVVRVLVEMLVPCKGQVYDACCGSAGVFVRSEASVEEYGGRMGNITVYWKKPNSTARRLAIAPQGIWEAT